MEFSELIEEDDQRASLTARLQWRRNIQSIRDRHEGEVMSAEQKPWSDEEKAWFLNGATWLLVILRDSEIEVDEPKLLAFLRSLADGTVSRIPTPAEMILQIERLTGPVSEADKTRIREGNLVRRRVSSEADRQAAEVLLAFYGRR